MCSTGRCAEGMRYSPDREGDARYHDNLRKHPEIAWRNANRLMGFLKRHDDCQTCSQIKEGIR